MTGSEVNALRAAAGLVPLPAAHLDAMRRPCSCGEAWADEPGHDNDIEAEG